MIVGELVSADRREGPVYKQSSSASPPGGDGVSKKTIVQEDFSAVSCDILIVDAHPASFGYGAEFCTDSTVAFENILLKCDLASPHDVHSGPTCAAWGPDDV